MNLHLRTMISLALITVTLTGATELNKKTIAQTTEQVQINTELRNEILVASIDKDIKVTEKVVDEWYIKDIPLTKEQQKYVIKLCKEYDFDPLLIYAVMKQESNFTIDCESETNDFGIMQLNRGNFKWLEEQLGKDLKFLTFEDNVLAGIFMLDHYRNSWKNQLEDNEYKHTIYFLNSYNMGISGYKKYVSRSGNYNGRTYAKNIMEYYKQYSLGNFKN